jgi:hypothetical protein
MTSKTLNLLTIALIAAGPCASGAAAQDPATRSPAIDLRPDPAPSPYAGSYLFAAVDLRGDERTAGVGGIWVGRDSVFKGYIRNHESGAVRRLAGKVMRNGRLEFVPGFDNVRHDIRVLLHDGCVHGLSGRYLVYRPAPDQDPDQNPDQDPNGVTPAAAPERRFSLAGDTPPGDALVPARGGVVIGFHR